MVWPGVLDTLTWWGKHMIQILYDAYKDVFSALGDLLLPKQRVDQAGLANIGVAKGADSQHFPLLILRVKYYI